MFNSPKLIQHVSIIKYVNGSVLLYLPRSWRKLANVENPGLQDGFSGMKSFDIGCTLRMTTGAKPLQNVLAATQFGCKVRIY